jgi:PEP-CTERM motif
MKFHAFVAGAAFAALTSFAHAAVIERTFDVTASGFFLNSGSSSPAPVDPVELNFTLLFDPSVTVTTASTAGLTINSFSLPNPPYSLAYTYDSAAGYLILATYGAGDVCYIGTASYCVTLHDPAGAAPGAYGASQTTDSGGIWQSTTVSVTASSLAAPEPSTWALMLIGFGGVGWLVSRRRGEISHHI